MKDGTSTIKISVNGIEYKEIKVMVGWIAIYTEEDLINMKNGLDKHYILMNNITLKKEWIPIGSDSEPFSGVFDGNYNKIERLTINNSETNYQGFIGRLDGSVRNLTLDVNVKGHRFVGGVAGYIFGNVGENVIENVRVEGEVVGAGDDIGGLVGFLGRR